MNQSQKNSTFTSFNRRDLIKSLSSATVAAPFLGLAGTSSSCSARVGYASPNPGNFQEDNVKPPVTPQPKDPVSDSFEISNGKWIQPGFLTIIQGPTSDTETHINLLVPKLKNYLLEVTDGEGRVYPTAEPVRVTGPAHSHVMKLKVTGLQPNVRYSLQVFERKTEKDGTFSKGLKIDQRYFSTLDMSMRTPRFALVSCMADEFRFDGIIPTMWKKLESQNVDFLILTGDIVYVDAKESVERKKATELDIWQRFIDAMRKIPLYHWINLKPILATWDDHDFGTNDGDRDFIGKDPAKKLFHALFFGTDMTGVWEMGPGGTTAVYHGFGQRFFMMDDRTFRLPNNDEKSKLDPYGHWGSEQHNWLIAKLSESNAPSWIINGNQTFRGAPDDVNFVESMQYNHPAELDQLKKDLRKINAPVVFGSGDVHLSEVMNVYPIEFGYQTYEFTSSSMHSFLGGDGKPWKNERRLNGMVCPEFNFMTFRSQAVEVEGRPALRIEAQCMGAARANYFDATFEVVR